MLTTAGRAWGTGLVRARVAPHLRKYRRFKEGRAYAQSLELRSGKAWRAHTKSDAFPADIPANPNQVYAYEGWRGMGDWLGTGAIASRLRTYRPFAEARAYVAELSLRSEKEWRAHTKDGPLPADIPANPEPDVTADDGWQGMGDWLGTGTVVPHLRKYRRFKEARAYAQSLALRSEKAWRAHTKSGALPADIPANPKPGLC